MFELLRLLLYLCFCLGLSLLLRVLFRRLLDMIECVHNIPLGPWQSFVGGRLLGQPLGGTLLDTVGTFFNFAY